MGMIMEDGPVSTAVTQLAAATGKPRIGVGRDLLREARDGLADATEAYRQDGLDGHEAERQAVADFGAIDRTAADIQEEIGAESVRLTGFVLGVGYIIILGAWAALYAIAPPPSRPPTGPSWATSSFDVIGLVSLLAAIGFFLTLRLGARRQRPVVRSLWLMAGTVIIGAILTLTAAQLVNPFVGADGVRLAGGRGQSMVELLSLFVLLAMGTQAVRCVRQALRHRMAYSPDARRDDRSAL